MVTLPVFTPVIAPFWSTLAMPELLEDQVTPAMVSL